MTEPLRLFAVAAPGLEPTVARELSALNLPGRETPGGVEFEATLKGLYRTNLHLRTATRILLRVAEFTATEFYDLFLRASKVTWERWLSPARPMALRVTCHKSRLYHSGAVAERLADAIAKRLGARPAAVDYDEDSGEPPQLVVVRMDHNRCHISIDTSGAALHRRGYRLALAKAPLRETLAAALLLAAGYDGTAPLVDPFCGSGTIPIEAALIARRAAPGRNRTFACHLWPDYDAPCWTSLIEKADAGLKNAPSADIWASDRDEGAVESAQANAARAGAGGWITFSRRAVSNISAPERAGFVVTNPPYGVRISGARDLRDLYARFGQVLRDQFPGWKAAFLCNDRVLAGQVKLPLTVALQTSNGGIPVSLYTAAIPPSGDTAHV